MWENYGHMSISQIIFILSQFKDYRTLKIVLKDVISFAIHFWLICVILLQFQNLDSIYNCNICFCPDTAPKAFAHKRENLLNQAWAINNLRLNRFFHFSQLLHFAALPPDHGLGSLRVQIFSLYIAVNESLELVVVQAPVFVQITPLIKIIIKALFSADLTSKLAAKTNYLVSFSVLS